MAHAIKRPPSIPPDDGHGPPPKGWCAYCNGTKQVRVHRDTPAEKWVDCPKCNHGSTMEEWALITKGRA